MNYLTNFPSQFLWMFEHHFVFGVVLSFVLGLLFASFGGLIIERLPHQLGWIDEPRENYTIWAPRSHCDNCSRVLSPVDLIPVLGWLLARGRCKLCDSKIPSLYPASEFAIGLSFSVVYTIIRDPGFVLSFWVLIWTGYIITLLDIRHHWIPSVITAPLLWAGLMWSPFEPEVFNRIYGAVSGGTLLLVTFFLVWAIKKEDVYSGGDVAFITMAGAWLGTSFLLPFVIMSCAFFAAHAVWEGGKGNRWVPFGPTLVLGLLITAFIAYFFPA